MAESDDEDFAALLAESERASSGRERRLQAGEVVRGRVISVGATTAFVAVGGKAEAAIDVAEFRDQQTGAVTLKEGDEIEATVVDDGAQSGSIVLKRVAGRGGHLPGELEQAFANRIPVEAVVTGEVKGGYSVQIGGVRAFCPGSQIDRRRVEGKTYVGERLAFRIFAEKQRQFGLGEPLGRREQDFLKAHVGAVFIGNFDADGVLARNRCDHADAGHA